MLSSRSIRLIQTFSRHDAPTCRLIVDALPGYRVELSRSARICTGSCFAARTERRVVWRKLDCRFDSSCLPVMTAFSAGDDAEEIDYGALDFDRNVCRGMTIAEADFGHDAAQLKRTSGWDQAATHQDEAAVPSFPACVTPQAGT